jgi:hypothetical protein
MIGNPFSAGVELACHFNSRDELRQAYSAEQLLKVKHGWLVTMRRVRRDNTGLIMQPAIDQGRTDPVSGSALASL